MAYRALLLMIVGCYTAYAIASDVGTIQSGNNEYPKMVEALNGNIKDFDYLKFRTQYTKTKKYRPYTGNSLLFKSRINTAVDNEDYVGCIEAADEWLNTNHTSIDAHFGKSVCCKKRGLKECNNKHMVIVNGLLDSIVNEGDGETPETAYETFSSDEIYFFMGAFGLKVESQSLLNNKGRVFDVMKVKSIKSGNKHTIYFDITTQISNVNDNI